MTDAGGPGASSVKPCVTTGLADLGDTEGFNEAGTENTLYAFQLSGGVYKRVEVPAPQQSAPLKFGDLNDVTVTSLVANRDYKLHYTGTEWKPAIDTINALGGWDLDIKLVHPYLSLGAAHAVKKIKNKGQLLATYVPGRKNNIIVENNPLHGYVLGTKGARSGTLTLINEFGSRLVGPGSTIFIEAVLGDRPDDFVPLLDGLKLKWLPKASNQLVHIYIRMPNEPVVPIVNFSLKGVTHKFEPGGLPLATLHLGPIKLRRLYYSAHSLTTSYLKTLIDNPIA